MGQFVSTICRDNTNSDKNKNQSRSSFDRKLGIPNTFVPVDRFAPTLDFSCLVFLSSTTLLIVMDIMSATDFYGEMECVVNDENFHDIFGDFETFSDSHSES